MSLRQREELLRRTVTWWLGGPFVSGYSWAYKHHDCRLIYNNGVLKYSTSNKIEGLFGKYRNYTDHTQSEYLTFEGFQQSRKALLKLSGFVEILFFGYFLV